MPTAVYGFCLQVPYAAVRGIYKSRGLSGDWNEVDSSEADGNGKTVTALLAQSLPLNKMPMIGYAPAFFQYFQGFSWRCRNP